MRLALIGAIALASCSGPGAPSQNSECQDYLVCKRRAGFELDSADLVYACPHGPCYTTTQAKADQCTIECKVKAAALNVTYDAGCR